ncbi:ABC transporter permease subunit, partial [Pediococcus pentosaceus]
ISKPLSLLYTNFAIVVGLVYLFLPIMVTSLVGSIDELNIEVEEAAAILGASPSVSFFKVIIPQLITGILTGCILVFAGSMTAYTTPQILGGNRHLVMATLIYQESMTLGDWNSASIVAVILIVLTVISIILMRLITRRINRGIENA